MLSRRSTLGLLLVIVLLLLSIYDWHEIKDKSFEDLQAAYEKSRTETMNSKFDTFLSEYLDRELSRKIGVGDLYSFGMKLRLFKKLHKLYGSVANSNGDSYKFYKKLETHLFAWVFKKHRSIDEIVASSQGKGIVIITGDKFAPLAANCINALRLLGCHLPVEIFFHGSSDLSLKWLSYFSGMKNVKTVDIQSVFDMTLVDVPRWAIKSFAALGSSFQENIVLDADAVLLMNPEALFLDQGYGQTGTLFFTDRTMFGYHGRNMTSWIDGSIPGAVSDCCKSTKIYRRLSNYHLKTGLMLIDKSKHVLGLLAACRLGSSPDFDRLRKFVHGDKELIWIGMELAEELYHFMPSPCGSIGIPSTNEKAKSPQICGRQAHFDTSGELLWFNDGLCVNKNKEDFNLTQLTHFVKETSEGAHDYDGSCLKGQVEPIEGQALVNLHRLTAMYEKDPLDPAADKALKL